MRTRRIAKDYGTLDSEERASLFIRAISRRDDRDAEALLQTSPDQRFCLPRFERLVLAMEYLAMEYQVRQLREFSSLLVLQSHIAIDSSQETQQRLRWCKAVRVWSFEQEREAFESFCLARGLEVGHFGGVDNPAMRMAHNRVLLVMNDDDGPSELAAEFGYEWPCDVEDSNARLERYETKLDATVAMLV